MYLRQHKCIILQNTTKHWYIILVHCKQCLLLSGGVKGGSCPVWTNFNGKIK
jgi:hypothetical protein